MEAIFFNVSPQISIGWCWCKWQETDRFCTASSSVTVSGVTVQCTVCSSMDKPGRDVCRSKVDLCRSKEDICRSKIKHACLRFKIFVFLKDTDATHRYLPCTNISRYWLDVWRSNLDLRMFHPGLPILCRLPGNMCLYGHLVNHINTPILSTTDCWLAWRLIETSKFLCGFAN